GMALPPFCAFLSASDCALCFAVRYSGESTPSSVMKMGSSSNVAGCSNRSSAPSAHSFGVSSAPRSKVFFFVMGSPGDDDVGGVGGVVQRLERQGQRNRT